MGGERDDRRFTVKPFAALGELQADLRAEQRRAKKARRRAILERAGLGGDRSAAEGVPDRSSGGYPAAAPGPAGGAAPAAQPATDADLLAEAMAGVVPLADRDRVVSPPAEPWAKVRAVDEAKAVEAYLRDLVDGVVPFDIADTEEYIEGAVQGFDRRTLRSLRRGEIAIQGHIDLHGMTRDEARDAVARFVKGAHGRGLRCVLIVHGRGLNSKDQIPVLKEKLKAWLTRGSIGTKVLAFASARPYDGGAGAVYVLLRR
jgi:DNA-nicking Smr family endonuclease